MERRIPDTPEELIKLIAFEIVCRSEKIHSMDVLFELTAQGITPEICSNVLWDLIMQDEPRVEVDEDGYLALLGT